MVYLYMQHAPCLHNLMQRCLFIDNDKRLLTRFKILMKLVFLSRLNKTYIDERLDFGWVVSVFVFNWSSTDAQPV